MNGANAKQMTRRLTASLIRYLRFHFQSILSIGLRGLGVVLGFVITWFVGNQLGAAANGYYALITQTAMFLSIVAVGGIDIAILRDFSAATAYGVPPARRSFLRVCMISLALVVVLIALIVPAVPHVLQGLQEGDAPRGALVLLATLLAARAITRVTSAFLRSQRAYVLGQVIEVAVIPAIVVAAILAQLAPSLDAILLWTAAGGIAASAVGIVACLRQTNTAPNAYHVPIRGLMKAAWPLWGVAVSRNLGDWYGLAVVAAMLSVNDAGIFRVAMQIGAALAIISVGILSVFAPQIGAAHAKRDYPAIARLTRSSAMLSTVVVLPVAAASLIFAEEILGFIGPEFRSGALLVQIIVLGQALFVCTGTSGITLALTGHEKVNLALTLGSMGTLAVLVPLAALYGGLNWVGAAIAVVMVGRNIGSMIATRQLLGIAILTGRYYPLPHHRSEKDTSAATAFFDPTASGRMP